MGIATAVVGGVVAVAGKRASNKAGKQAQSDAYLDAEDQRRQTEEELRRLDISQKQTEGMAKARAAAGGGGGSGQENILSAMETSHQEEQDWLSEVGASAYQSHLRGGEQAKSQANAAGWSSVSSGVGMMGSGYSMFKKYGA